MSHHQPVMKDEILQFLRETRRPLRRILDGTFGRGGHTRAILEEFSDARVVAFDHDMAAVEFGRSQFSQEIEDGRLVILHRSFGTYHRGLSEIEGGGLYDAIILDLGVSSPQLDEALRGFSFYLDGPLDMRMDQRNSTTAAIIINEWSVEQLRTLFFELGEVFRPQRVISAIVHDRKTMPFSTTRQLASLIERVEGWGRRGHHPATKYFLALRLAVNQELAVLKESVTNLIEGLNDLGRIVVLTFHSLEDRIVKFEFRSHLEMGSPVNKKVIRPSSNEVNSNPRSRSAKLRVFERHNEGESYGKKTPY